jgi:hypothetical protein
MGGIQGAEAPCSLRIAGNRSWGGKLTLWAKTI